MKRSIPFGFMVLTFLIGAGAAESQTLKIGYLNSQEVLNSAPGATAAQAQFEREMQGYQQEIQQLEEELRGMERQLQQQQLTLSPEAKANREQQLQTKVEEYQQRGAQLQETAARRRAELVQPVMDQITAIIERMREEGSYHLILDVAAGSIVSADPALDLTQEVIRRLEADAAGTGGS